MNTVGQGVKEIRIRDEAGAFPVLYVAKFADAVYVLHCFQKKTEKTSKADLELAAKRYRELLKERGQRKRNVLPVCGTPSKTRPSRPPT
jgi:phage-related protein